MSNQYAVESREEKEPRRFFVYREVDGRKVDLCQCETTEQASLIINALNFMSRLEGRITQEIPYDDGGSIFLVVIGEQAQTAYEAALPYLTDPEIDEWPCPICGIVASSRG